MGNNLLAAYMVPHPPLIVPAVGKGSEQSITETARAYERVAEEIAALKPETIIITSPHSVMYSDYFHISPGKGAHGDLRDFGAGSVKFDIKYDTTVVERICALADYADFPAGKTWTTGLWYRSGSSCRNTLISSWSDAVFRDSD